jgi:DNA polymerase-1
MKLLLVDGSNLVMRAAFGGDIEPRIAVPIATGLIHKAARQCAASHLIVALDVPGAPSWRKQKLPTYKAHRTRDTAPWFLAAHEEWSGRLKWFVEGVDLFEADDVIATIALRAKGRAEVVICSGDSDLLPLTAHGFAVLKPENGGKFKTVQAADVCAKYQIASPDLLRDLKALTGEDGDNIPGVPGIGPVKAGKLLQTYRDFAGVMGAAQPPKSTDKDLLKVAEHAAAAHLAYELIGLRTDADVLPVKPSDCRYHADGSLAAHHEPQ